jgi:hypothetical protein
MLFIISLLPATIFVVVAYFILYTAVRAEGGIKRFGQYLGIWVLLFAGGSVLGGLLGSTVGIPGLGGFMDGITQHMETMSTVEEQQLEIIQELQRD